MRTGNLREVTVETLTLVTVAPHLVPIRSIITLFSREVVASNMRRLLVVAEDIVIEEERQAARVLGLDRLLSIEFVKNYAKTWDKELRELFTRTGMARLNLFDLIRVGSLLGEDGGRRAAMLTLRTKYQSSTKDRDWLVWLSEECRAPDPGSHVGMVLINNSGVLTQSRLYTQEEHRHVELLSLMLNLSDAKKADKRRALKDFEKRRPLQQVKRGKKTETYVGKKFDSEEDFFAAFAAASTQPTVTSTL